MTYIFDPTPPMFELDQDIINTNILSKFEKDWVKTVAAIVLTRNLLTKFFGNLIIAFLLIQGKAKHNKPMLSPPNVIPAISAFSKPVTNRYLDPAC